MDSWQRKDQNEKEADEGTEVRAQGDGGLGRMAEGIEKLMEQKADQEVG